ncbi:MAG: DegV family protein [Bacillus sp. (in: firmicutes)]
MIHFIATTIMTLLTTTILLEEQMKKAKVAWITDSSSSLPKEFIAQHHIHVIPLNIMINQVSYKENIEITEEELYHRMSNEEGTFQTSLPSIGEFVNLYKQLKKEYDFGIAIHLSSKLSGTYNTSVMAAEMAGFKLYHIDSLTGSFPLGHLIQTGIALFNQGIAAEEVLTHLHQLKQQTRLYIIPANLNQLHKSGRVSGSQKLLASLFQIKPILAIEEGEARIKEKVRSHRKAMATVIKKLKEDHAQHTIKKVAILHANDLDKAHELNELVQTELPGIATETLMLISVAGVHTGAKTVGLSWVCE